MKKRITALFTAAVFVLLSFVSALPAFAVRESGTRYATPDRYNDHDYQAVVSFLEIEDGNGVKNGEKLCERLGTEYDPEDPRSWSVYSETLGLSIGIVFAMDYTQEHRLQMFLLSDVFEGVEDPDMMPCGALDLSDCGALYRVETALTNVTSLDLSGCKSLSVCYCFNQPLLTSVDLSGCRTLLDICFSETPLAAIDVSDCEALEYLWGWNTALEALDVSNCPALLALDVNNTQIASIDLSHNPELRDFRCAGCQITELDLSHNPKLELVYTANMPLASLDLTGCSSLSYISCYNAALTELDASDCAALETLYCGNNFLTELDVSGCPELAILSCYYNYLTELDLSNNPLLSELICVYNALTELDLSNNPYLPFDRISTDGMGTIGTGYSEESFVAAAYGAMGHPFLRWTSEDGEFISDEYILYPDETEETRVVAVFEGDKAAGAEADAENLIPDETSSKPEHDLTALRSAPGAYIEHDYEAVLAFMETADENGVKNGVKIAERLGKVYDPEDPRTWSGYCDEVGYAVGAVFAYDNRGISLINFLLADLFYMDEDIETTPCGELDLSGCHMLYRVEGGFCNITMGDFTGCRSLAFCTFYDQPLESLTLAGCPTIYQLEFTDTDVTEIDVSDCRNLECLWFWDTAVEEIDVTNNPELYYIHCGNTLVSELDLTNNPELNQVMCYNTPLTSLDLSRCPKVYYVEAQNTLLEQVDLSGCSSLTLFGCSGSSLEELDLSDCSSLEMLGCSQNRLTELDVSHCPALTTLYCEYNLLTELDLSGNPLLQNLSCFMNQLTELDLTNNPLIPFDSITAEGPGSVGTGYVGTAFAAVAYGDEGYHFAEWRTEDGGFISDDHILYADETDATRIVAVFEQDEFMPGDVNGDGEVTLEDALLVMRAALELTEFTPGQAEAAEMNGDGIINLADALLILRLPMGIRHN